jgi:hypothetical protein
MDCGMDVYRTWAKEARDNMEKKKIEFLFSMKDYLSIIILAYRDVRRLEVQHEEEYTKNKITHSQVLRSKYIKPSSSAKRKPMMWYINEPSPDQLPNVQIVHNEDKLLRKKTMKDELYMEVTAMVDIEEGNWLSYFYGRQYERKGYSLTEDHMQMCDEFVDEFNKSLPLP